MGYISQWQRTSFLPQLCCRHWTWALKKILFLFRISGSSSGQKTLTVALYIWTRMVESQNWGMEQTIKYFMVKRENCLTVDLQTPHELTSVFYGSCLPQHLLCWMVPFVKGRSIPRNNNMKTFPESTFPLYHKMVQFGPHLINFLWKVWKPFISTKSILWRRELMPS
jgi:hypothetical protein